MSLRLHDSIAFTLTPQTIQTPVEEVNIMLMNRNPELSGKKFKYIEYLMN